MQTRCCDGRSRTATELAAVGSISASTASAHLRKLELSRLVEHIRSGRHRYFRLSGPEAASALEALFQVSAKNLSAKNSPGFRSSAPNHLRFARTCYDHAAGELAVRFHDHCIARHWLERREGAYVLTGTGEDTSPTLFVIPRVFTMEVGNLDIASQPIDSALDTVKGNLWVLNKGPVINSKRGAVAVINLEQKKLLNFIFVGDSPIAIAVAAVPPPNQRRLCVVLNSGGVVSAIELDSMEVIANIQVIANAVALDISPDGRWAYVLHLNNLLIGNNINGFLSIIDMTAAKVVGGISVGRAPTRVVFSLDGQFAVVNNTGDGTISLIDVKTRKVSAVKVGGDSVTSNPQEVVFSQKNFPMWTANSGSRNASVIGKDMLAANIDLDLNPMAVAINSSGTRSFLMGPKETLMTIVVTAEGRPIQKTISKMSGVAGNVEAIATTPDDRGVIAIHSDTNTMSVLETKTLGLRAVISLPGAPLRCLITNDGKFAVVLCPKTISLIEMESVLPTGA